MRIRVTNAFWLHGHTQPEGAEIEVPDALGHELMAINRAERLPEPATPPEPETPQAQAAKPRTRKTAA